jgi:hypothetical protein
MATHTSSTLRTHRESHHRRQDAYRVPIFFMAALLIAVASLFGCGGGVTSTDSQPPAVSPVTGATGSATLTWAAPSTNEDGTPLSSLGGYKVYYGTTPGVYTSINVGPVSSAQVAGLTTGAVYYFAVSAYDSSGNESDLSEVVSKVIG